MTLQLGVRPLSEGALLRPRVPGGTLEPRDQPAQGGLPRRRGGIGGRGLHSSTFQLKLSRF
jgi:hypothetical protein